MDGLLGWLSVSLEAEQAFVVLFCLGLRRLWVVYVALAHVLLPSAARAGELTGGVPETADPLQNPYVGGGQRSLPGSILSSARPRGVHPTMSTGRDSVNGRRRERGQSLVLVVISMTVLL